MDLKISPENPSPWRGGESEGLQRLEQHLTDQVSPDGTQGDGGGSRWAEISAQLGLEEGGSLGLGFVLLDF